MRVSKCIAITATALVCCMIFDLGLSPESDQAQLEQLLKQTISVMDNAGVEYWVAGGTLFGVHLCGCVQRGDFDADLMILVQDVGAMRGADWHRSGLHIYEGYGGFRVKKYAFGSLRVDIFVRTFSGDGHLHYAWPRLDIAYPRAVLPIKLIYPVHSVRFLKGDISVPHKPQELLLQQYGSYTMEPPWSVSVAIVSFLERQVWCRIIPLANLVGPVMPY